MRDLEIKVLLRQALTDDLHSMALIARSIDASWSYEGFGTYRAEDLSEDYLSSNMHDETHTY